VRPGTPIAPLIHGGGQEGGLRAGTENVALVAALGTAAELAQAALEAGTASAASTASAADPDEPARQRALRDRLFARLRASFADRVRLNGHPTLRLPNTLNVSIDGIDGAALLAAAPGVAASTGSACHSGVSTPSPVLTAMGVPAPTALGAIRLSVGRYTTEADVDLAADLLAAAEAGLDRA
jgi:cysteine desulfurase